MPDIIQRPEQAPRESIWKRLTRLFRSGPVVRHKVEAGEQLREPKGTARAYKKELSSLYVHSLASYGQYERLSRYSDFCLTGDTRVSVPYSTETLTMREIVERFSKGEDTHVFSFDLDRGRYVSALVTNAFSTGVREVWEVTLDDGTVVRCTPNHRFMLRDGSYKRADELSPDTALMPFRRWTYQGYRFINTMAGVRSEHRMVAAAFLGHDVDRNSGKNVHHVNFNRVDNHPSNLRVMTREEHLAYHAMINNRRFDDPSAREHMGVVMSSRWSEGGDLRVKHNAGTLYTPARRENDRERRRKFNQEFRPGRFNKGRTDQGGLDNGNADKTFTFQHVCDAYRDGMQLSDLCRTLGQTPFKVKKRIELGGFSSFSDFVERYSNHKVVSVRPTGQSEEVFDLTVDGYHNFVIENCIPVHNCEMEFCLTESTLIAVPGGFRTIGDLARECTEKRVAGLDDSFVVFSYDHQKGHIVPAVAKNARMTRRDEGFRVKFDNGKEIIATADHRLMLRDGSYRKVCELVPGQAMMPFKRGRFFDQSQYVSIYDGLRWVPEHRMLGSFMLGRPIREGEVVHHVNGVKNDNRLENLEVMTRGEHASHHLQEFNSLKWNPNNERWIEKFKAEHSRFMTENNPSARKDVTFARILQFAEGNDFHLFKTMEQLDIDYPTIVRRLKEQSFNNWEAFATAYSPGWKNHGQDNRGELNPRWDASLTFQDVCDAFEPGMTGIALSKKLGTTPAKVSGRVKPHGFKSVADFCKNYSNCRVVSVEPAGEFDMYDLTVDGYKNFATDSVVSHNTPEIASALDIYADETTAYDENGAVIAVVSENQEVKQVLETLFFNILNIEFNVWSWVRNLCKYGDFVLFVDASEENGILNLLPIPINEIEREEGYDANDPFAVRFRWLTQGNTILENWQVIHFRLLGNDSFLPYGSSVIEPARRIWRQLILIEDAMLVYRIVRSPERRVFKIDVGNIPPDQVDQFMEQIKTKLRRNQVVDPTTGRVDLRYNPLSVDEDYFIPVRGDKSSDISTLAGGQFPVRRDTLIPLMDGRTLSIEELAKEYDEGKENWVHSVQEGTNTIVPGKVIWCGKNYTCDRIHRIWFDNETYADMAPEHPVLLRDGTKKRADQLLSGESLMPFRTRLEKLGKHDYRAVQDPSDDEWKFIHRLAAGCVKGRNNQALHHMDFDRFNNRPDNLQWMGYREHIKLHGEHARQYLHTPEMDKKNAERISTYNSSVEGRQASSNRNRIRWSDQNFRSAHSGDNHWLRKKWAKKYETLSPDVLATFCREHNVRSFKELIECQDSPLVGPEQFRACLRHHGIDGWSRFASEFLGLKPRNHTVLRVEVLEGISDDVYCMTVTGPQGEDDRHNFALLGRNADGSVGSDWDGVFVSNTGDIDDVQYIQNKLFAALKVPKAYLGYEGELGSKATLSQQDVRFARTIERIQKIVIAELSKIAIIHLFLLGYTGEDLVDFELKMANSSTIAEQQKLELWRMRFEIAGTAQEGMLDRETIYRKIFAMSDEEIEKVREGKRVDKMEDLTLEAMQAPAEAGPAGEQGGGGVPGEEELPKTLGGEPGGAAAGEAGGEPPAAGGEQGVAPEGVDHGTSVVEKRNPGSEGDDAYLAVDKGKDLFATGEDQFTSVFGTEKQTASDPGDLRYLRRLVTRPFSEGTVDERLSEGIEATRKLQRELDGVVRRYNGAGQARRPVRRRRGFPS